MIEKIQTKGLEEINLMLAYKINEIIDVISKTTSIEARIRQTFPAAVKIIATDQEAGEVWVTWNGGTYKIRGNGKVVVVGKRVEEDEVTRMLEEFLKEGNTGFLYSPSKCQSTHGGAGYAQGSYWDGEDIVCGACGIKIRNPKPLGYDKDGKPEFGRAVKGTPAKPEENDKDISLEFDAEITRDILLLVDKQVPLQTIEKWTNEERRQVMGWASAVHLDASDNDDVEIPDYPEVLKGLDNE